MSNHYSVIIVGGGQAGLSMSYCLKERGIDHLIFEKHQIAHSWRTYRWDSFCLVTPNWQCQLPNYPYSGDDPNGFMKRDEIVRYIESYAASFAPPIKEGVEVLGVSKDKTQELFHVATSIGQYTAEQVVIATGGYHRPKIPSIAERLPEEVVQLHSSQYKNPQSLPDRAVLVVGTGQSGCQIAEDLHLAGKQVHLCVGGAPRSPRRYRGKDVVDWLDQMGYYDLSIDEHPQKEKVRTKANHYVTGRDGGREIDLREFALQGMQLHGRLKTIHRGRLEFWDDLQQNLDQADAVAESIKNTIDRFIETHQIDAPTEPPYQPVWQPESPALSLALDEANIGAVVWCTGYHADFSWVDVPVFDGKGYPGHDRGVTSVRGLYFLGLPWLYTWGSGRFSGIARDATYLADYITTRQKTAHANDWSIVNEFLLGS
ncbi:MSMEG_0569 family flavin-dependent oxidoreductase [Thermocoleostomius sinensis]|uniref:MSMEG_0569 family flavin-dependent oxidoreductase n=1 Tax=Thermocoleostomius sinensis A174 TaxID=2016057 RepID=A0A9E8ZIR9_9CYAN|nr:MSMEG_0569 family flavin-dependent oxidoreductase [Thermocoleostomius sinensis]WAL62489.1 MSMEG_0569 family flavin-dependent oxidoreductase [Thermocoleostomius sinensis A174]